MEYMTENEKARAFENVRVEWYKYLAHLEEEGRIATSKKVDGQLEYEFTCDYHTKIHTMMHMTKKSNGSCVPLLNRGKWKEYL